MGFRVQGLGLRGLGFRVQGFGSRASYPKCLYGSKKEMPPGGEQGGDYVVFTWGACSIFGGRSKFKIIPEVWGLGFRGFIFRGLRVELFVGDFFS